MPLKALDRPAADDERFEVRFAMEDGERQIECFVTYGAIEEADGDFSGRRNAWLERFESQRVLFELIASRLYDQGQTMPWITPRELHRWRKPR